MTSRLIITGKNHELPRRAFTLAAQRSGHAMLFPYSGMTPESAAGGTRQPCGLPKVAPSDRSQLPLGAIVARQTLVSA